MMRQTDVIVVGGGVAGLYAALTAAAEDADVLVLSKGSLLLLEQLHGAGRRRGGARRATTRPSCTRSTRSRGPRPLPGERRAAADRGGARRGSPTWSGSAPCSNPAWRARAATRGGASCMPAAPRRASAIAEALAARVRAHPRITVERGRGGALSAAGERAAASASSARAGRSPDARRCSRPAATPRSGSARRIRPGTIGEGLALAYRAGARARRPRARAVPPDRARRRRLPAHARRCAATARCSLDDDGARFTDELAPRDVVARAIAARGQAGLDLRAIDRSRYPGPDRDARARGLRPGARADPGLAGGALHDRRHRHRSRRAHHRRRAVRGRRVRLHRRARREPARLELAARVPRLRPPRRARRARRAGTGGSPPRPRSRDRRAAARRRRPGARSGATRA